VFTGGPAIIDYSVRMSLSGAAFRIIANNVVGTKYTV